MTNRSICIHAHFYQPPRENPWLEEVEVQDSAYPHHDWNQRVTAECYAPNAASRILGPGRNILDIINNYSKISFNFGPTLLSWMERREPEVYAAILEADRQSQASFSGHGSALAQVYSHVIMPLASARDKQTEVIWGIRDFEHRFGRRPEGMWLAETAADTETLEALASQGIAFTILAPRQARRTRRIGEKRWKETPDARIDPRRPYLNRLPSGKAIALFFYDGPIAHDIAFGNLLDNGEVFARRLAGAFTPQDGPQLVHVATDGETYGHHHRFGDMALSYCLHSIEANELAQITVYGEYLERHPPVDEVEIVENSSWSCAHGVRRWHDDCGCNTGGHPGWNQQWRAPLRGAMDWLKESLDRIFEEQLSGLVRDAWQARDDYIRVILDRSPDSLQRFFAGHAADALPREDRVKALRLLEMQRHALSMFTSCGWFFDDVSGIESIQVMKCAARAIQLANEVSGIDLEQAYRSLLERAQSNLPPIANGASAYELYVAPAVITTLRVGAHYAISSLFTDYAEDARIYCYEARREYRDQMDAGRQRLVVGRAHIRSTIVGEEESISYAVLHLGDHNLFGGVRAFRGDEAFADMHRELREAFTKGDVSQIILAMDAHVGSHSYSLWHLFKDEQRKVVREVIGVAVKDVETAFRQIFEHHYPVIQAMHDLKQPLPRPLATTVEFILNTDLRLQLLEEDPDDARLEKLSEEVRRWSVELDRPTLTFAASGRLKVLSQRLSHQPGDVGLMAKISAFLSTMSTLSLELNLWRAQNAHFAIGRQFLRDKKALAEQGDADARRWLQAYDELGHHLDIGSS